MAQTKHNILLKPASGSSLTFRGDDFREALAFIENNINCSNTIKSLRSDLELESNLFKDVYVEEIDFGYKYKFI